MLSQSREGFDDQQIAAMDSAYQEATSVLQVRPGAPSIVHQVIAARLIEALSDPPSASSTDASSEMPIVAGVKSSHGSEVKK